jgi:hypothetical protein
MNGLYKIEIFGFEQRARSLVLTAVMLCIGPKVWSGR